ncbi:MAG: FHA domain-containing protein [Planctomycetes bacterium]|nr:FHA domain-containing protein [Planctomycetota bacterium]MCB9934493.1 FHA domain-containing protein [Planctomycetota bacterium]
MKIEIRSGSGSRVYVSRSGAAYISVGARPESDIVLEDPAVSPLHLKIEHFVGRWSFTDQMSDSGTKLNGESAYSGELAKGDKLTLGGSTLTVVSLEDETEAASSPSAVPDRSWQEQITHSEPPLSAGYERRPEPNYDVRAQASYGAQAAPAPYQKPGAFQPSGSQRPRQPAKAIAVAAALMVVAGVGVAMAFLGSGSNGPAGTPRPEVRVRESVPARDAQPADQARCSGTGDTEPRTNTRMPDEVEDEIKRQLDALVSQADTRVADDKLADYAKLKARAGEYGQHGLSWPLERVQTILRNQLFDEIQQRYSKDNLDIYHLKEEKKFGEALDRLYSLDRYLKQSDLHKELAKVSDMTSYVERELELLPDANFWYIGECFARADEALQRDDYEAAILALKEARDNARLEQRQRTDVSTEIAGLGNLVIRQRNGDLPAARAVFDKRKDKLPAAPVSALLPKGDSSAYSAMNALKRRLEEAWKSGALDQAECGFFGRKARLQPKGEDWRMELEVTREFGATVSYTYRARYAQHQLPPGTMISLYEALNPTRDELLAMLLICFNEGLLDDAPRIACKLWKADESVKADLDQLLATKLKIEIPDGGFKEKDGRLVAE